MYHNAQIIVVLVVEIRFHAQRNVVVAHANGFHAVMTMDIANLPMFWKESFMVIMMQAVPNNPILLAGVSVSSPASPFLYRQYICNSLM